MGPFTQCVLKPVRQGLRGTMQAGPVVSSRGQRVTERVVNALLLAVDAHQVRQRVRAAT
ncbi:hypothetical protein [Ralstonia syzygii]|nr:hypothetical protein [Ralstonia syzygii]